MAGGGWGVGGLLLLMGEKGGDGMWRRERDEMGRGWLPRGGGSVPLRWVGGRLGLVDVSLELVAACGIS